MTNTALFTFWIDFLVAMGGALAVCLAVFYQFVSERQVHGSYIMILTFVGALVLMAVVPQYSGFRPVEILATRVMVAMMILGFDIGMAWWLHTSPNAERPPSAVT